DRRVDTEATDSGRCRPRRRRLADGRLPGPQRSRPRRRLGGHPRARPGGHRRPRLRRRRGRPQPADRQVPARRQPDPGHHQPLLPRLRAGDPGHRRRSRLRPRRLQHRRPPRQGAARPAGGPAGAGRRHNRHPVPAQGRRLRPPPRRRRPGRGLRRVCRADDGAPVRRHFPERRGRRRPVGRAPDRPGVRPARDGGRRRQPSPAGGSDSRLPPAAGGARRGPGGDAGLRQRSDRGGRLRRDEGVAGPLAPTTGGLRRQRHDGPRRPRRDPRSRAAGAGRYRPRRLRRHHRGPPCQPVPDDRRPVPGAPRPTRRRDALRAARRHRRRRRAARRDALRADRPGLGV
ncbi:MAG: Transcriptional regulator, LacI family, partial [uncultured Thermomicrobiales bacterium]